MSLKDGSYKKSPVAIDALIAYPKKGEGPFPILVFNHASGGAQTISAMNGLNLTENMAKESAEKRNCSNVRR